jgi:hypothetical protein
MRRIYCEIAKGVYMANEKKIYRYTAGGSGSSTQVDDVKVVREKEGIVLRGANYLLGRLPSTKNEFEHWSPVKRIIIGYLLWLIVLPVWPFVVIVVLWVNRTMKRKVSTFAVLVLIAALWCWMLFSLLGLLK